LPTNEEKSDFYQVFSICVQIGITKLTLFFVNTKQISNFIKIHAKVYGMHYNICGGAKMLSS